MVSEEAILDARRRTKAWREEAGRLLRAADSLDEQTDQMSRQRLIETRVHPQDTMQFREHRGGFAESMKTVVVIPRSICGIVNHLNEKEGFTRYDPKYFSVTPYGFDDRCGWNCHLVMHMGSVVGMTDHPLEG